MTTDLPCDCGSSHPREFWHPTTLRTALEALVVTWSAKASALRITRSERHIGQAIGLAEAASALEAALATPPATEERCVSGDSEYMDHDWNQTRSACYRCGLVRMLPPTPPATEERCGVCGEPVVMGQGLIVVNGVNQHQACYMGTPPAPERGYCCSRTDAHHHMPTPPAPEPSAARRTLREAGERLDMAYREGDAPEPSAALVEAMVRDFGYSDEAGFRSRLDAIVAAARAEGLDVERLTRALDAVYSPSSMGPLPPVGPRGLAERIAAAYREADR